MKRRNKKKGVPMPRWTKAQVAALRHLYPSNSSREIGWLLGRSTASVSSLASRMGLKKSAGRLVEMGRENVSRRWE